MLLTLGPILSLANCSTELRSISSSSLREVTAGRSDTEWEERRAVVARTAAREVMAVVARRCEIKDEPILLILL
jgi:hypothetical protein